MTDLNAHLKHRADEDLTWLARNVHNWRNGANYICVDHNDGGYVFHEHNRNCAVWFTKDQWLASRSELQNKPSWKDAPEWAQWLGQDSLGRWLWHERKPRIDGGIFKPRKGIFHVECHGEVLVDWRDTLEHRPQVEEDITDPFDPEFRPEPSSDDWHKRGELPPVGLPVQLWYRDRYTYDCEMVAIRGEYVILWCTADDMAESLKIADCRFRPLQTERERVANELVDVMMAVPVSDRKTASESYMSMALAIYDHLHPDNKS